ncbi:MAG: hypothetical protein GY851_05530 [bacterium]|nr:hypothetical protein [bacterium]
MLSLLVATQIMGAAEPDGMDQARAWAESAFAAPGQPFFSFTYGERSSAELLPGWNPQHQSEAIDDARTRHTLTWSDPETGLQVRCEAVQYRDFPVLEWTLHFRNTGSADTPILSNIQALDAGFERGEEGEFVLHHHNGDGVGSASYEPLTSVLGPKASMRFAPTGGRPTDEGWPYFNVEWAGGGLVYALGWPGQWAAEFTRDDAQGLRIRGGQDLTHFKLLPGEEVRTPLVVLHFYQGDWIDAQNVWRRWVMAHSMPRPNGAPPEPMLLASSSRAYSEMIDANEQNQIMFIDRYLEERLGLDYWWMDAGWYPCDRQWPKTGTWEIDTSRFPDGFKPIVEHAHAKGLKVLVWFEPERVAAGTWLTEQHPDWVHGGAKGGLLRLDKPEVLEWLTEHVDALLVEQGIDLYRQDFNMRPLDSWRANDAEDRQGITEIRHITNYLAYFDELRRRHPNMLIDTCASGGRRLDIETYRRAVPLWRSDYVFVPLGMQCLTYGLSMWLPYHGTGTVACADAGYYGGGATPVEPYAFWSTMANSCSCGFDLRETGIDYDALRALFDQWRVARENYSGDFYPLTPHSQREGVWMAWQFNRAGQGMVQAFRRKDSVYELARLPLRGLDADATYRLRAVDGTETWDVAGSELLERGLLVELPERAQATTILYERTD